MVAPKKEKLAAAEAEYSELMTGLNQKKAELAAVEANLAALNAKLKEMQVCQAVCCFTLRVLNHHTSTMSISSAHMDRVYALVLQCLQAVGTDAARIAHLISSHTGYTRPLQTAAATACSVCNCPQHGQLQMVLKGSLSMHGLTTASFVL